MRRNVRIPWLKISSIGLIFIAIFGLLGSLGLTSPGRTMFSLFTLMMGKMAWIIPFICLIFSFILWPSSSPNNHSRRPRSNEKIRKSATSAVNKRVTSKISKKLSRDLNTEENYTQKQTFPLPATKIVPIRGFDKYFASTEWSDQADIADPSKMEELGSDFPSYFGEGQRSFINSSAKITTLKGLKSYIEEVDYEVKKELVDQDLTQFENSKVTTSPDNSRKEMFPKLEWGLGVWPKISRGENSEGAQVIWETIERGIPKNVMGAENADFSYPGQVANLFEKTQADIPEKQDYPSYGVTPQERELLLGKRVNVVANKVSASIEPEAKTHSAEITLEESLTIDEDLTIDEVLTIAENSDIPLRFRRCWQLPNFNLLENIPVNTIVHETESSKQLEGVLQNFGITAKVIRVTRGPVITRYELAPAPGVKISRIVNLADDIALGLAARDVRIEAPIPGKSAVGIEVPNKNPRAVSFREVLETPDYAQNVSKLKAALGKDIADQPVITDLSKMPHLLVAGATGSGKSVCITTLINSLLFNATPDEVKFLLVDPKMVELNHYNGIPHLLAPVVTDPKKASAALKWIVKEMETRYELFAAEGVRDIERYNKLKIAEGKEETVPALPWIVVIIDELADLMLVAAGEVEEAICRLAQMARAAGIHLVIATQRPSVDVITGIIKANIPSRISFAVTSSIDSRTILDATGAEKLLGKGDMLYSPQGMNKPQRVQGCLVNDEEVQRVIVHWKSQGGPDYLDSEHLFSETNNKTEETSGPDDSLFINAGQLFISSGIASVSYLQRRLKLGYARAARLMDMLEENGVVGRFEGSKPRQILLNLEEFNERFG
ncbi:MAG: DNA translocase FtsK [Desulfitobacteriaceae bacterium]